jgi:histidine ammonia-lyase
MQENIHQISRAQLSFVDLQSIVLEGKSIELSQDSIKAIEKCRAYLDEKVARTDKPIYGVNTGFGSLCNHRISEEDLSQLQANLMMSHACGTGEEVPQEIVKLMLLLKVQSLSYGNSGVQLITVQRLVDMYNKDILPIIYQQGSLGASGDLAPLAHLSLPLIGMGEVFYEDRVQLASVVLEALGWEPIVMKSKEGLALLNGTQFMSAYGSWSIMKAYKLSYLADLIATISLEAFDGRIEPFDELIHFARPHNGQIKTAERIREFLEGSELIEREKEHVQDPYSFRCIPQVHGASKQAIKHVSDVMMTEINSVTDNPNLFVDADKIISGGNFHGQPIAIPMDYLSIALHELGNISERRIYQLVSGLRGLPAYLVAKQGLNSGFMIPQYTAASIVSQSKLLCTPASADSIVSSNGQEDHVSMGANGATKLYKIVENLERVLAIELMNAAQAIEFREEKTSPFLQMILDSYREEVSFVEDDRYLHKDIMITIDFLRNLEIDTDLIY